MPTIAAARPGGRMVHRVGHAAGVGTGLVWAGTEWVVATVTPTIEDRTAAMLDQAMDCYASLSHDRAVRGVRQRRRPGRQTQLAPSGR